MKQNSIPVAEPPVQFLLKKYACINSVSVILIGILVLLGWQFDIVILKQFIPGMVSMNPITAVSFIFLGAAFLLLQQREEQRSSRLIAKTLASLVLLIGSLRLSADFTSYDTGIDRLIFPDKIATDLFNNRSNIMSPITAFNFTLISFSLLLLSNKKTVLTQHLSLLTAFIALLSVIGYVYEVTAFHGVFSYFPMAIHTAVCFLLLSVSIFLVRSDKGFMAEISSPYGGGKAARLLLPMAVLVPLILGALSQYGEKMGLYSISFGKALDATANIIVFVFLIWKSLSSINRSNQELAVEISEHKKTEETLQKSLKEISDYKYALDESSIVAITNQKGIIQFANENFCKISKYSMDELIGRDNRILNSGYHPKEFMRDLWVTIANGKIWRGELKNKAKDGTFYWVDTTIVPYLNEQGKPFQYVAIRRDITQRKIQEDIIKKMYIDLERKVKERTAELAASEQRFRALIENSTDAISLVNASGRAIYQSPAVGRMTGFSIEDRQAKSVFEFVHSDDISHCNKLFSELLQHPGVPIPLQHRMYHKNGFYIWIEGTAINLLQDENVNAIVFNFRDITERKQAEEQLHNYTVQLKNKNKELEQFTYITSHDLQEPLRTINSFVGLIEENYQNNNYEKNKKYFHFISQASDRMSKLIKGLLDYSRIGNQKEIKTVDCNWILEEVKHDLTAVINENSATINVLPLPSINAYPQDLRLLFQNLLSNAIKFRKKDTPPIIDVYAEKKDNGWVFAVKDNGIGIDERFKGKIFSIFQRLHTKEEYDGTGIGLAHCKKIAELHNGEIWVESKPNEGSIFYFTIPFLNLNV